MAIGQTQPRLSVSEVAPAWRRSLSVDETPPLKQNEIALIYLVSVSPVIGSDIARCTIALSGTNGKWRVAGCSRGQGGSG